jgi:hypothetical protein
MAFQFLTTLLVGATGGGRRPALVYIAGAQVPRTVTTLLLFYNWTCPVPTRPDSTLPSPPPPARRPSLPRATETKTNCRWYSGPAATASPSVSPWIANVVGRFNMYSSSVLVGALGRLRRARRGLRVREHEQLWNHNNKTARRSNH